MKTQIKDQSGSLVIYAQGGLTPYRPAHLMKKEGWTHNVFFTKKRPGVTFRISNVYKQRVAIMVKKGKALAAEGHGFLEQVFVLLVDNSDGSTIMRELSKFKAQFQPYQ